MNSLSNPAAAASGPCASSREDTSARVPAISQAAIAGRDECRWAIDMSVQSSSRHLCHLARQEVRTDLEDLAGERLEIPQLIGLGDENEHRDGEPIDVLL